MSPKSAIEVEVDMGRYDLMVLTLVEHDAREVERHDPVRLIDDLADSQIAAHAA